MKVPVAFAILAAASSGIVSAHHSIASFDTSNPVSYRGTIVEVAWKNPHITFAVDVPNGRGGVERWSFEGGHGGSLTQQGVSRTTLRPGETVTVLAYPSKRSERLASAERVTLVDGTELTIRDTFGFNIAALAKDRAAQPSAQPSPAR